MADTDWTNEQLDDLLEIFLERQWEWNSIVSVYNSPIHTPTRTADALRTEIWKLATRYNRQHIREYTPGEISRTDRTNAAWHERDYAIIAIAFGGAGIRNKACEPEWLSRILGRDADAIEKELDRLAQNQMQHRPSFKTRMPARGRLVLEAVSRHLRAVKREIGFTT